MAEKPIPKPTTNVKKIIAITTVIGIPLLGWILLTLVDIPKTYATKTELKEVEHKAALCGEAIHRIEVQTERADVILRQLADREGIKY
jgi:hypothetical protein